MIVVIPNGAQKNKTEGEVLLKPIMTKRCGGEESVVSQRGITILFVIKSGVLFLMRFAPLDAYKKCLLCEGLDRVAVLILYVKFTRTHNGL